MAFYYGASDYLIFQSIFPDILLVCIYFTFFLSTAICNAARVAMLMGMELYCEA